MRILNFILVLSVLSFLFSCQGKEHKSAAGYPYTLHVDASGATPDTGDVVSFHLQQRIKDSIVFSTREGDQLQQLQIVDEEGPNPVENAFNDVFRDLSVGDSVTIPINIDTVENLPDELKDVGTIYFDVVIEGVQPRSEFEAEMEAEHQRLTEEAEAFQQREEEIAAYTADILKKYKTKNLPLKTTPEGLKYIIHEEGTGASPAAGDIVYVNYYGLLTKDGTMFDNSFRRGRQFNFPLGQGQVIPGWDIGIALMKEGGKATFVIPAELAYGEQGAGAIIPPNAELMFYVELEKVVKP